MRNDHVGSHPVDRRSVERSSADRSSAGEVRLQKFMADCGVASRRKCEELILDGLVKVNGRTVSVLGTKINPLNVKVTVEGKSIQTEKSNTYIAFYKPRGVLSTMLDDRGRPCVGDYFGERNDRLFHVGRLDKESEGLLLLTNDGEWANSIAHPSSGVLKTYWVETEEELTNSIVQKLRKGIRLSDGVVKIESADLVAGGLEIKIHEGRNQIVRRIADALGLTVTKLVRTRIGRVNLGELKSGKWRYLSNVETL